MSRADRVDEAAKMRVVADDPQRSLIRHRSIDRGFDVISDIAALDDIDAALDRTFNPIGPWLVRDIADRTADRARAEQGSLRTAQRLHAVEVEQVEIRRE